MDFDSGWSHFPLMQKAHFVASKRASSITMTDTSVLVHA